MLAVAVPRLEFDAGAPAAVFGLLWTSFALLVVAANLYALLGMDEETALALARIRRAKRAAWERRLEQAVVRRGARS
ncbi:hypothetical protein IDH44_23975 [Paenibacillus sp. IB182496]|uniref:Uncharacterized protein n=2 Tax=Paenibacillus sabuli TaxID=2772509 RepID=A0A927GUK6_9BACL|nr:hypothetical protein [Paenibacillus sabuli]